MRLALTDAAVRRELVSEMTLVLALCIPIVQKDDQAAAEERDEQAQFYGDEALKMLRDAVAKGYRNAAHMAKNSDLAPLRERDDFKKLLEDLKAK